MDELSEFNGTARFEVLEALGEGGMGVVYAVLDRASGARVALKTLRSYSPDGLLRLKQEFRALADIHHRNLIGLHELIFDDEAGWFFTMELVEGPTLLEYVRRGPIDDRDTRAPTVTLPPTTLPPTDRAPKPVGAGVRFDEGRLRDAMSQLVVALMALHDAGKIHRDIKPSNVLVDSAAGRVVVLDFGLAMDHDRAAQLEASQVDGQTIVGTIDYMAPEQAAAQPLGPESDWYAVGVMLFEALTGDVPFKGHPLEILFAKQRDVPPAPRSLVPGVPADLDALCVDLLRFRPGDRPTAEDILARLGRRERRDARPSSESASSRSFVGREAELTTLKDSVQELRIGRSGAAVVVGESGVGKSALVQRFLSETRADVPDAVVLAGRCHERESVPFKAFDGVVDALSRYLVQRPPHEMTTLLPEGAALLAEVFPVLSRVPSIAGAPDSARRIVDAVERRNRVFAALRDLLHRIGEQRPVLMVIEDLQWSDVDSRALLAEVLRQPHAPQLLLVGTTRSSADDVEIPANDLRTIDLGRLAPDDAMRLARHLAATLAPGRSLALEALVAEADGHPLFLEELVRFGATGTPSARPVQLEDALRARVDALAPEARRLLELLAIASRPIVQETVAHASELGPRFPSEVAALRVARLVRTTGMRGTDRIETFHDRVRGAILRGIDVDLKRALHRRLAVAFETSQRVDPEAQMGHWEEAGERAKAAHHAELAADHAAHALAFDRAVRLYQHCLELGTFDAKTSGSLRKRLGDALANAGRGVESAFALLDAAATADSTEALDLRRRAAEALLRSGQIDRGLEVVRTVLGAVGLTLPSTPGRVLASLAFYRARLRLRGLRLAERAPEEVPMQTLARIDVCWAVGTGLAFVDTIRGAEFQARNLFLSLEAGEPRRVSRALCLEAMFVAASGTANAARVRRLLDAARGLSERFAEPHLDGLLRMAEGGCQFLLGHYRETLEHLREAEKIFLERCTGVFWELSSTHTFTLWSHYFVGELRELAARAPLLADAARYNADLHTLTNVRVEFLSLCSLLRDDPDAARDEVRHAMGEWTNAGTHLAHFWEVHATSQIDLYCGDPLAAYERIAAKWRELERALIFVIEQGRVEGTYLRGRAAVGAALTTPARRDELLRAARRDEKKLRGERAAWARPLADILGGSIAAIEGHRQEAATAWRRADTALEKLAMTLHRTALSWRLGELDGTGPQAAETWLRRQGVTDPARLVGMLVPPLPA